MEQKRGELRKLEDGLVRSKKELEQRLKEATTPANDSEGDDEKNGLLVCSKRSESSQLPNDCVLENPQVFDLPDEFSEYGHLKVHAQ